MKKYSLIVIFITALLIFNYSYASKNIKRIYINKIYIDAELAISDEEKVRGLMFRKNLKANQGMLFIFDNLDLYSIWMKNMNFAIDIIWISEDKMIVDIIKYAQPCKKNCPSLMPKDRAMYVLEVVSGFTEKNNIEIGDKVKFD